MSSTIVVINGVRQTEKILHAQVFRIIIAMSSAYFHHKDHVLDNYSTISTTMVEINVTYPRSKG